MILIGSALILLGFPTATGVIGWSLHGDGFLRVFFTVLAIEFVLVLALLCAMAAIAIAVTIL